METSVNRAKIVSVILAAIASGMLGACTTDTVFYNAADAFANKTVGPEYSAYVAADTKLSDTEKQVRVDNVTTFRKALDARMK